MLSLRCTQDVFERKLPGFIWKSLSLDFLLGLYSELIWYQRETKEKFPKAPLNAIIKKYKRVLKKNLAFHPLKDLLVKSMQVKGEISRSCLSTVTTYSKPNPLYSDGKLKLWEAK